jgi:hypothetical protein
MVSRRVPHSVDKQRHHRLTPGAIIGTVPYLNTLVPERLGLVCLRCFGCHHHPVTAQGRFDQTLKEVFILLQFEPGEGPCLLVVYATMGGKKRAPTAGKEHRLLTCLLRYDTKLMTCKIGGLPRHSLKYAPLPPSLSCFHGIAPF